ncbi:MAG: CBS domain-containing protein [Sedimentisphaerales bacterium]|nr:CBS domain-containing protein [Sedimentisphaerales bacterium]
MAGVDAEVELRGPELLSRGFEVFCEDISTMFGISSQCRCAESGAAGPDKIAERFKGPTAAIAVDAKGLLDGRLQLVFDHSGLSILSGVILMLPEETVRSEIERGSITDIQGMTDAIQEMGNLLLGSWQRVFLENTENSASFSQSWTFLGNSWDELLAEAGLQSDVEYESLLYEMTIASYPSFYCSLILPKGIAAGAFKAEAAEFDVSDAESDVESQEDAKSGETEPENENQTESAEDAVDDEDKAAEVVEVDEQTSEQGEEPGVSVQEPEPVSAVSVGGGAFKRGADTRVEEIMDREVVWCSPEDSVEQALAKMQQSNVGYIVAGDDGKVEGIISTSTIAGAMSPYLRPAFSKWRRPLDDATLKLRVKWIMSRPVRTVRPDTSVEVAVAEMRRFRNRCLPVVDEQGRVLGMVTVFSVLSLIDGSDEVGSQGKETEAPVAVLQA